MNKNPEDPLDENIRVRMQLKGTEELLEIWNRNDHKKWSDPVFPVVKEILLERLGKIPEQGSERENPIEEGNSRVSFNGLGFLTGWLIVNLLGWMIGIYSLIGRSRDVYSHLEVTGKWQLPDAVGQILVMICVPLGLGLGVLQSFQMGRWKIAKIPWIVVTFVGWTLPALVFSKIRWQLLFADPMGNGFVNYLEILWILYPLALLWIGAGIGLLQLLVMGKSMTKPGMWILANALGLLVFGWMVNGIFRLVLEPMFVDIISLAEMGDLSIPPYLVWPVIAALLPFLATLIIALPTGLVLCKYGKKQPEKVTENIEQDA